MLVLENLSAGYQERDVLQDISFSVHPGEFISIVAPNGTGKSTLLKCITGILPLRRGAVRLKGKPLGGYSPRELARTVAVVAEESDAFLYSAEQIVTMGRFSHIPRFSQPSARDRALVQEAMENVNIWHKRRSKLNQLSQGEKQKVTIARALAQSPQLLLLDEPTSHLDIANQYTVLNLIQQLARQNNIAVIAVLHDINLALRFSTRLILLKDGQMLADGPPDQVTAGMLETLYGMQFTLYKEGRITYVQPCVAQAE